MAEPLLPLLWKPCTMLDQLSIGFSPMLRNLVKWLRVFFFSPISRIVSKFSGLLNRISLSPCSMTSLPDVQNLTFLRSPVMLPLLEMVVTMVAKCCFPNPIWPSSHLMTLFSTLLRKTILVTFDLQVLFGDSRNFQSLLWSSTFGMVRESATEIGSF